MRFSQFYVLNHNITSLFVQLYPELVPPSAAQSPSLALGGGSGAILDWVPWCCSSVTQATPSTAPALLGVKPCPTAWPSGTALCPHARVCTPSQVQFIYIEVFFYSWCCLSTFTGSESEPLVPKSGARKRISTRKGNSPFSGGWQRRIKEYHYWDDWQ